MSPLEIKYTPIPSLIEQLHEKMLRILQFIAKVATN